MSGLDEPSMLAIAERLITDIAIAGAPADETLRDLRLLTPGDAVAVAVMIAAIAAHAAEGAAAIASRLAEWDHDNSPAAVRLRIDSLIGHIGHTRRVEREAPNVIAELERLLSEQDV